VLRIAGDIDAKAGWASTCCRRRLRSGCCSSTP